MSREDLGSSEHIPWKQLGHLTPQNPLELLPTAPGAGTPLRYRLRLAGWLPAPALQCLSLGDGQSRQMLPGDLRPFSPEQNSASKATQTEAAF